MNRACLRHICFVAPNLYPVLSGRRDIPVVGGSEFQMSILARAFAARGHTVTVITQDFGQADGEVIAGVRIINAHCPGAGLPGLRYLHPRLTSFWQAMRRADADVYYQQNASHLAALVAWYCRRHGGISIYAGASDTDFMRGSERMKFARDRWLFRWGLQHVDAIVAQSERQVHLVRQHYGRAATIIHNPYSPPERVRQQSQDLVLWVGGIRPVKRPDRFIALARALPGYRFRMIGGQVGSDAEARSYFESIRDQATGVANLEFLGFLPVAEVEDHFDEAHLFVNTSEHEGFPNTFLQAWGRGIPTVSLFDAGVRADGSRPFRLAGNVDDAAIRVQELMADEDAWRSLSADCQDHFSVHHATDSVVGAFEDLFGAIPGRLRA